MEREKNVCNDWSTHTRQFSMQRMVLFMTVDLEHCSSGFWAFLLEEKEEKQRIRPLQPSTWLTSMILGALLASTNLLQAQVYFHLSIDWLRHAYYSRRFKQKRAHFKQNSDNGLDESFAFFMDFSLQFFGTFSQLKGEKCSFTQMSEKRTALNLDKFIVERSCYNVALKLEKEETHAQQNWLTCCFMRDAVFCDTTVCVRSSHYSTFSRMIFYLRCCCWFRSLWKTSWLDCLLVRLTAFGLIEMIFDLCRIICCSSEFHWRCFGTLESA